MKFIQKVSFLIVPALFFVATPEVFAALPSVSTGAVSNISSSSITLNGTLINNGGSEITSAGFNYGIGQNYTNTISTTILSDHTDIISQNQDQAFNLLSRNIATDSAGNIYVVDTASSSVKKFNSSGSLIYQFGNYGTGNNQFLHPTNIAIDSSGNIYVSDFGQHKVKKFDQNGNYLAQIGNVGSGAGDFANPAGMALDSSGNIYIADPNNNRVQKFTSSGIYLSQFGSFGENGNGYFVQPTDIAIDSSGNIYVLDSGTSIVQKFNSSGVFQSQFGSQGFDFGQFVAPKGIEIDSFGNIYIADSGNNRVQKFNSFGIYQSHISFSASSNAPSPQDIAFDSEGNMYTINIKSSPTISVVKKIRQVINPKQVSVFKCGKTYNYRVFAVNADGINYGNNVTFTTPNCRPYLPENRKPADPTPRPIATKPENKQTDTIRPSIVTESKEALTATVINSIDSKETKNIEISETKGEILNLNTKR